jgi:phage-related protein
MSDIGLKIGIEGEKEFKKALSDINQSFKVLGSEMNLVASQFEKQDHSIEAITARNQVLNKEIDTQKDKITTLEKALGNATSSFGENDRRTKAWAVQLNNAKAELNSMERELEQNNKALDKTANEFDDAEKQADQFGDELKKSARQADDAGSRFNNLTGVLKGVGVALGATVTAIGTAAVGAGKALVNMTVSSAAYADEILTQSTVTGMSTEKLQAYKYAAELVDTDLETLTSTMARNVRSMDSASKGTGSVAEAYKKLGVSVTDTYGNLRDGETVYWEAIDALGKLSNETERDALAMQLFGKSAQELNPLIAQGSAGMAALTEEAMKMGAVMSEDTLAALGKFDDSVQRLKSGASAAKNTLGTVLLPQLQILADDGVSLLGEFTSGLAKAGGDWGKISEVIGDTVGKFSSMLMENLPKLIQVGLDIVNSIGKAVVDNLPIIIDAAVKITKSLLQGLIGALPQITEGALQLVFALVDGIIENLPAIIDAALQMIITLAEGIANALPELIPAIVDAIILIVETLSNNMDKILDAAFKIMEGLAQGLLDAIPRLIEAIPKIISSIIDFVTNNLPLIIEMGIQLTVQLAVGLIKAIPQLVAKLPEIIAAIVKGLGNAVSAVLEIGVNIVKGLWEGIKSMGKWIWDQVTGFFGGIVDGVKGLLGIHSPSTVFEGIGGNMGKGVGVGFLKAMTDVERDMKRAIPTDFDISATMSGLQPAYAGTPQPITYNHTGTIRVEGVNDKGALTGVVDIILGQLRQEARL